MNSEGIVHLNMWPRSSWPCTVLLWNICRDFFSSCLGPFCFTFSCTPKIFFRVDVKTETSSLPCMPSFKSHASVITASLDVTNVESGIFRSCQQHAQFKHSLRWNKNTTPTVRNQFLTKPLKFVPWETFSQSAATTKAREHVCWSRSH